MHSVYQPTKHPSLAQPTLNMLRTLILAYSSAKSSDRNSIYIKCWIYPATYRIRYWKWKTHWLYVRHDGCNGTGRLRQWWSGCLGAAAQWAASITRNCHTTCHLLRKKKSKFEVWSLLNMHHFCTTTIIKLKNHKLGTACKIIFKVTLIWKWKSLSHVQLFATPWTIQSMEVSRPEYWSG